MIKPILVIALLASVAAPAVACSKDDYRGCGEQGTTTDRYKKPEKKQQQKKSEKKS